LVSKYVLASLIISAYLDPSTSHSCFKWGTLSAVETAMTFDLVVMTQSALQLPRYARSVGAPISLGEILFGIPVSAF